MRTRRGSCYSSAVIPPSWTPVTRPSDAEQVGWLVPDGVPGVVPASLVGAPLGHAQDRAAAAALLVERGLRSLDRRWWGPPPSSLPPRLLSPPGPGPGRGGRGAPPRGGGPARG